MHPIGSSLNNAAIRCVDLTKSYGSNHILKGISFEVPHGETLVILGRSGKGKSVLLRHVLGLENPDSGHVYINNTDIVPLKKLDKLNFMRQTGMLFQSSALFDSMSVEENVAFYLHQHGDIETKEPLLLHQINHEVAVALEKVGLSGFQKKKPSELSGGQKRRAALARLLVYKPKIMLYDEPTTGLDPMTASNIVELIQTTQKELEATAILVTHDMKAALAMGDLFALMDEGKIVCVEKKESFLNSSNETIQNFLDECAYERQQ